MKLTLKRNPGKSEWTTGRLFINDVFECFTIEDQEQDVKVMHETRIPAGTYEISLRTFGGHHERYKIKFKEIHMGMLWLRNVPGFQSILIHIGNSDDDSSGCILVCTMIDEEKGVGYKSTEAYLKLYRKVVDAFAKGEKIQITIE
jgi:hypothetical protein